MIAMRLEKALLKEIDLLAKHKDTTRSQIVREAIIHYLEDNEDLALAKLAKKQTKSVKSLSQLRKELDVES